MSPARLVALALVVLASACAGAATPRDGTGQPEGVPASPPPAPEPPARQGVIARAELDAVLARGLGRFLQEVETEPLVREGRFVGFRLSRLSLPFLEGVDLQSGDTVLRVNGSSVERPEQALEVWNGLRVASELTIEYLRDGERRQLRFLIED